MPTHHRGTPEEIAALNAYIKFMRASNSMEHYIYNKLTAGGLTPSQFSVLETIYHLGPMCQAEIGRKILKTGGNMTMVIDKLEKKELVKRIKSEADRRYFLITLTEKGEKVTRDYFPKHVTAISKAMSVLNEQELHDLGRLCKKLGTNIP